MVLDYILWGWRLGEEDKKEEGGGGDEGGSVLLFLLSITSLFLFASPSVSEVGG